jgi:hypothetical protein
MQGLPEKTLKDPARSLVQVGDGVEQCGKKEMINGSALFGVVSVCQ